MNSSMADDVGKLILRILLGLLILLHGIAKIQTGAASIVENFGVFGYAVFLGEVLGPVLLLIGWYARVGAGLIALNMLVAIAAVHAGQIFMLGEQGGWKIELQAMYLFTAVALVITGPGAYSLNRR